MDLVPSQSRSQLIQVRASKHDRTVWPAIGLDLAGVDELAQVRFAEPGIHDGFIVPVVTSDEMFGRYEGIRVIW